MQSILCPLSIVNAQSDDSLQNFNEFIFHRQVEDAMKSIESILDRNRNPVLLEDFQHTYQDKYSFVEFVVNSAIASYMNVFKYAIGVDEGIFAKALEWHNDDFSNVHLVFDAKSYSSFEKEVEMEEEEEGSRVVTETDSTLSFSSKRTTSVIRKVWISHYTMNMEFKVLLKGKDDEISIHDLKASMPFTFKRMRKGSRQLPYQTDFSSKASLKLNFLLKTLPKGKLPSFSIDREKSSCKTPCRNEDINEALRFVLDIISWSAKNNRFIQDMKETYRFITNDDVVFQVDIFQPIVPLVENSTTFSTQDINDFLDAQIVSIQSAILESFEKMERKDFFPKESIALILTSPYMESLSRNTINSIAYVENLLMKQLHDAIGKHVNPQDFDEYMRFHNKKFFDQKYAPRAFSYAVRRPEHYPDGVVSIEARGKTNDPIETLVRHISKEESPGFSIPIDPSTTVTLEGDTFVHGWMRHVWDGFIPNKSHLIARTSQFSSFLLVLGVMGGPDSFIPKHAIILQDKDEVIIPLLAEVLPSAKEFRDAIASLSPEQQEFAKAFRSMQLETSVFGLCVIQLKPQLEALLNLPPDSLSKEIRLTRDLMSLFVKYQIPSDLLSFDSDRDIDQSPTAKLSAVKTHVKAVLDVIDEMKNLERKNAEDEAKAEKVEYTRSFYQERKEMAMHRSEMVFEGRRLSVDPSSLHVGPSVEPSSVQSTPSTMNHPSSEPPRRKSSVGSMQYQQIHSSTLSSLFDPTNLPKELDSRLGETDEDGSLKSTIVKVGESWSRLRKENILVAPMMSTLQGEELTKEKSEALDLLTALSRSGTLPIVQSELHIIVATSHCFSSDLISTVIKENVNPIKKVEKSQLVLASVIYGVDEKLLVVEETKKDMNKLDEKDFTEAIE